MRVLAHICRVVSFAVKTRVMGHFVDLNCARRAYCVVVNEKRAVCTVSAKHLKEAVSWWQTRDRNCLLCQCNWCKAAKSGHYIIGPAARPRVGHIQAKSENFAAGRRTAGRESAGSTKKILTSRCLVPHSYRSPTNAGPTGPSVAW